MINRRKALFIRKMEGVAASIACVALSLMAAGCGTDAAGPSEIPLRRVTLEAVSQTSFAAEVGTVFGGRPSVRVRSENGKPASGVPVEFAVSGGAGISNQVVPPNGPGFSYSTVIVTSNSDGIASLATLRLPNQPGSTTVSATAAGAEPVLFHALAFAGPPNSIRKEAGDGQFIPAMSAAVVRPQIRVVDLYLNPVAGVLVTFSVLSGGGSITGESTYTNSAGIATVGSWTVGAEGSQTLRVMVEGFEREEIFTASIANSIRACGTPATLLAGTTVQAVMSNQSCITSDGKYYDLVTVNLSSTAYRFILDSPGFDSQLQLLDAHDEIVGTSNSQLKVIVPSGSYKLKIASRTPGKTGQYSIRYSTSEEVVKGCEEVFISRGLNVYQYSGSLDCAGMSDRFGIFLKAGQEVRFQVDDLSYSDHKLVLMDSSGKMVGFGVPENVWWIMVLKYTAPVDGFYFLEVSSPDDGAEYMLAIQ